MAQITYREALNQALREELDRDERVFIMGEEVAATIDDAIKFADESPEPSLDELGKGVYASEEVTRKF